MIFFLEELFLENLQTNVSELTEGGRLEVFWKKKKSYSEPFEKILGQAYF